MKNWINFTKNVGHVKQQTSKMITFESTKPLEISRVEPGCAGCTKFIDYKDNILTIKYDAPEFPRHIAHKDVIINKTVTVYYEDGNKDVLKFVGFLNK